jgi:hypothetical protein
VQISLLSKICHERHIHSHLSSRQREAKHFFLLLTFPSQPSCCQKPWRWQVGVRKVVSAVRGHSQVPVSHGGQTRTWEPLQLGGIWVSKKGLDRLLGTWRAQGTDNPPFPFWRPLALSWKVCVKKWKKSQGRIINYDRFVEVKEREREPIFIALSSIRYHERTLHVFLKWLTYKYRQPFLHIRSFYVHGHTKCRQKMKLGLWLHL